MSDEVFSAERESRFTVPGDCVERIEFETGRILGCIALSFKLSPGWQIRSAHRQCGLSRDLRG
jgi:hypothetical protein